MSYNASYGTEVLHCGSFPDGRVVFGASVSMTSKSYSEFKFSMAPSHPLYYAVKLHDADNMVELRWNDQLLFRGVVTAICDKFHGQREVTCASELVYLSWVVTRYSPQRGRNAAVALAELVGIYNSYANVWMRDRFCFQVDPESRAAEVGYIDPEGTGWLVVDAECSTPAPILDTITSKIVEPYGATLRLRYGPDGERYVGVFPDAPDVNGQTISFGENLTDLTVEYSDEGMYNACFPVGGSVDEIEPPDTKGEFVLVEDFAKGSTEMVLRSSGQTVSTTPDGLMLVGKQVYVWGSDGMYVGGSPVRVRVSPAADATIPAGTSITYVGISVADYDGQLTLLRLGPTERQVGEFFADGDIVYHAPSAARYGIRCMTFTDNDVTDPLELRNRAIAEVEAAMAPYRSIEVNAVDMALIDGSSDHLTAGQKVRVVSVPHGIDSMMEVSEVKLNLDDPGATRYTIGAVGSTSSGRARVADLSAASMRENFTTELNNRIKPSDVWRY